ncbi:MBL fold metallo-hydrolase [Kribbella sp. CA-247076]|uniref:MBL fold metallo-hydrolase n=1 Tax=Kribbella sp. CA-247076 TaxID=3239941 RepID=UPI003D8EBB61
MKHGIDEASGEVATSRGLEYVVRTATREGLTRDLPHGPKDLLWVANSATLIYGEHDAVLVDTYTSVQQNAELVDWVRSFDRNLTHIYITHGHGDHFFGLSQLLDAFPDARAVATAGTAATARTQGEPEWLGEFWERLFPGQIPPLHYPEALRGGSFELEGHRLEVVEAGYTDTDNTTCLWIPDLRLLIAGDVAYNDTHQFTARTTAESREEWARAAERLAELNPTAVIAGHKKPEAADSPTILAETARYLREFNRAAAATATAEELYDDMLGRYPRRANPGALWGGAKAAKP